MKKVWIAGTAALGLFAMAQQSEINSLETLIKKQEERITTYQNKTKTQSEQINILRDHYQKEKERADQENQRANKEKKRADELQKELDSVQVLNVVATAYTPFCSTGCTGITRTEIDVRETIYYEGHRVVAVDPNVIPLGSVIAIEGFDETFVAADTGGDIQGNRIDILYKKKERALAFGRQEKKVQIIGEMSL
jgi:3D (Asp-Asp-Asp) domain-containing protein